MKARDLRVRASDIRFIEIAKARNLTIYRLRAFAFHRLKSGQTVDFVRRQQALSRIILQHRFNAKSYGTRESGADGNAEPAC